MVLVKKIWKPDNYLLVNIEDRMKEKCGIRMSYYNQGTNGICIEK